MKKNDRYIYKAKNQRTVSDANKNWQDTVGKF